MNENINNSINFTLINYKNIMSGGTVKKDVSKSKDFEMTYNEILLPSKNNYTLYIKKGCPFCIEILDLFNIKFPKYKKVIIIKGDKYKNDNESDGKTVYIIDILANEYNINEFKKTINNYNKDRKYKEHNTFPMLYKNGILIGGCEDFKKLLNNKQGGTNIKNKIYKIIKL
jgi:glutaredoxin